MKDQKKFYLRVYDNYHYMDESEAYNHGQYETYEEALKAAKAIVDEDLKHNWKKGMKADELNWLYTLYGEDPTIRCTERSEHPHFSAWDYASSIVEEYCKRRK